MFVRPGSFYNKCSECSLKFLNFRVLWETETIIISTETPAIFTAKDPGKSEFLCRTRMSEVAEGTLCSNICGYSSQLHVERKPKGFCKGRFWRMCPHSGFLHRRSVFCTLVSSKTRGPGEEGAAGYCPSPPGPFVLLLTLFRFLGSRKTGFVPSFLILGVQPPFWKPPFCEPRPCLKRQSRKGTARSETRENRHGRPSTVNFQPPKSGKKKQHKHKFFGPDFLRTFLTLTPGCPGVKTLLPTTGAAGKRTFWCGRPRFSARTSMTRRVVEKVCAKKSSR